MVDYRVKKSRKGTAWWVSASYGTMRASNTLKTGRSDIAQKWIDAVTSGNISVGK